jgi:hypothetical protein
MEPCANCGTTFDSAYCPACGQKRHKPGIRLGEVVHEFFGTITHAEGPFLQTLLGFFRGPGAMTRAYIAGRRKAFVPPVRYFLVGIGYYYLIRFLFDWDPVDSAMDAAGAERTVETGVLRVNHWMSQHVNLLLPILILVLSAFDRVLFPRTKLSWVERYVHYLFAAGTYLIVATTLLPLSILWPAMQILNFLVIFGIIIWACISIHGGGAWTSIKAVVMVPVSFVLYVMLCTVLVALMLGVPLSEMVVRQAP